MKRLKQLKKQYLQYLQQNPKAFGWLKESCELLGIEKKDLKN